MVTNRVNSGRGARETESFRYRQSSDWQDFATMTGEVEQSILPVFSGREQGERWHPQNFEGTGFLLRGDHPNREVFVTCWHCVQRPLTKGESYRAVLDSQGEYSTLELIDLAQDENGSDLALARTSGPARSILHLGTVATETGDGVKTYGYPLTEVSQRDGRKRFTLHSRFLQGYVTQAFHHDRPGWGSVPSYELDMLTPAGLSGAPLIDSVQGGVTGVIYGGWDVAQILSMASIDPETGTRIPEVQRLVSFGLAHYHDTLVATSGPATTGLRLRTYLNEGTQT